MLKTWIPFHLKKFLGAHTARASKRRTPTFRPWLEVLAGSIGRPPPALHRHLGRPGRRGKHVL